ncbi:MAG TPA: hypothetical protein VIM58_13330, partial [Candidatus Methylacidiphilales bacterium]
MKTLHFSLLGALVLLGLENAAQAQWTTSASAAYTTGYVDPANWSGGTPNDQFTGTLYNTGTAFTTTLTFTGNYAATGKLNFSYTDTLASVNLILKSSSSTPYTITLANGITVDGGLSSTTGTDVVTLGTASGTSIGTALNLDVAGKAQTFAVSPSLASTVTYGVTGSTLGSGADILNVYGAIVDSAGGGSVTKTGFGVLNLFGANTVGGTFTIDNGVVNLAGAGGSLSNVTSFQVNALPTLYAGGPYYTVSALVLNNYQANGQTSANNNSRISSTAAIGLNGGMLVLDGVSAGATAETVGAVTLHGGHNVIDVSPNGAGGTASLTLASLTQANNAVLSIASTTAIGSAAAQLKIQSGNDANILSSLIGGGGTGSYNTSILPWAYAGTSSAMNATLGNAERPDGGGLVTYTSAGGFQVLSAGQYNTVLNGAGATDNVMLTASTTLTANQTINALYLNGANASQILTLTGGTTLSVTSGVLLDTWANAMQVSQTGTGAAYIDFGNNTGYVYGAIQLNNNVVLKGQSGVVFAGPGAMNLYGANAYSGTTTVAGGQLNVNANNALPVTTDLRIAAGAVFSIQTANVVQAVNSLSGNGLAVIFGTSGQLNIGGGTGAAGKITLNAGGTIAPGDPSGSLQVGTLTLGTVAKPAAVVVNGGNLNFEIQSAASYDVLNIVGGLTINSGTLNLSFLDGYSPT